MPQKEDPEKELRKDVKAFYDNISMQEYEAAKRVLEKNPHIAELGYFMNPAFDTLIGQQINCNFGGSGRSKQQARIDFFDHLLSTTTADIQAIFNDQQMVDRIVTLPQTGYMRSLIHHGYDISYTDRYGHNCFTQAAHAPTADNLKILLDAAKRQGKTPHEIKQLILQPTCSQVGIITGTINQAHLPHSAAKLALLCEHVIPTLPDEEPGFPAPTIEDMEQQFNAVKKAFDERFIESEYCRKHGLQPNIAPLTKEQYFEGLIHFHEAENVLKSFTPKFSMHKQIQQHVTLAPSSLPHSTTKHTPARHSA